MFEMMMKKAPPKAKPWELLMHCDGVAGSKTWLDEAGHTFTELAPAVTNAATPVKFGNASLNFINSALVISTGIEILGDYTVTAWIYRDAASNNTPTGILLGNNMPGGDCYPFLIDKGAVMANKVGWIGLNMPGVADVSVDGGIAAGRWIHTAAVREGTNYRLYVDGIKKADITDTAVPPLRLNRIGGGFNGVSPRFRGYADEIGVSKQVLYTGDFAIPTQPYTYG